MFCVEKQALWPKYVVSWGCNDPTRRRKRAMDDRITQQQFATLLDRLDRIERAAVTKHDVFQAVLLVQGAWTGVIVGTVVVLAAVGVL